MASKEVSKTLDIFSAEDGYAKVLIQTPQNDHTEKGQFCLKGYIFIGKFYVMHKRLDLSRCSRTVCRQVSEKKMCFCAVMVSLKIYDCVYLVPKSFQELFKIYELNPCTNLVDY